MKRALWIFLLALLVGPAASAQIAQRGVATTNTGTTTSLTINKPTGVVAGDVMIVNIAQQNNNTTNPTLLGWTLIQGSSLAGGTLRYGAALYKVATGSEPTSYTFTLGTGVNASAGAIVAFSGVDPSVFDVTPVAISVQGSQTTVDATSVTTVTANDAIVMLGMAAGSGPSWTTAAWHTTNPANLTQLYSNPNGSGASVGGAWALKATTGATGTGTATLSTAERNGGILLALKPLSNVPTITKGFAPVAIAAGGTSTLTLTITNPSASVSQSSVAVTDNLPPGMTQTGVATTCASGIVTASTPTSIVLTGGTIAASGSCTVTATVASSTPGASVNTTGNVSSNNGTGLSAIATLTVVGPATITKSFAPTSVAISANSVLTLTITNPAANTVALTGLAVTDSFPANLVVAATPSLTNSCGGTTSGGTAGATSVGLSAGSVAVGSSCTIVVNVDSATAGSYPNTTGAVSSTNGGTGAASNTATLTVTTPPSIAKAFSPTSIPLTGTPSTLTLTITNPSATQTQTGLAVTDTFPAGLVVATPPVSSDNGCSGTFTATQGAGSISLTGGSLAASGNCTLVVNVSATTAGSKSNTTGTVSSTNGGNGNTANAVLTVIAPPTVTKAFAPTSIAIGGTATLTITITNPAGNLGAENGVAITDNLPAGMSVAATPGATNSCGGTFSPNPGDTSLSLSGGTIATAGSNCAISVSITDSTAGAVTNTTGAVSSTSGGTGLTANAAFTVNNPPTVTKTFNPTIVAPGASSQMTITITNPAGNSTITGVNFTDTFPAGLVVQNPNGASTTGCTGSTFSPLPNATAVTFSVPASVTVGTSCVVKVNVQSPTVGSYLNTTGPVTSTNAGPGTAASATLVVAVPPGITKTFAPSTIALNGTSTLTLTFSNSVTNTGAMNGIAVTDTFPAGMQVASSPNIGNSCGATFAPAAGNTSLTVTNGTIATPGTTCQVNVDVTATTAGSKSNTTGAVSSTNDGTGTTANGVLTVVAPPTITKAFGLSGTGIGAGGSSTMTITITNPAANTVAETGVAVSDTLPGTMTFSVAASTSCGVAVTGGGVGTNSVSISGATINTGASCTITASVTDTTVGTDTNTTSAVSSTNGGTGLTATATLPINAAPTVTKTFTPTIVALNATSQLTITITNSNAINLTGVAITDNLPSGMVVQATGTDTGCAGATFSDVVNSSLISITGATVANGTPCVIKVNVKSSTPGANVNTTGTVSSTNGGTGTTASATLTVTAPPTITKVFAPATIALNGTSTLTLTFTNPAGDSGAMNGIAVTDTFPAGMQVAGSPNIGNTCGATFAPVAGNTSLTVTNGTIANPGDSCEVNVDVTGSTAGTKSNTTGTVSSTNDGTGTTANAVLTVVAPPTITKAFGSSGTGIRAGGTSTMTITITNPAGNTVAETGVTVSDTLPGTMTFSVAAVTSCGVPVTGGGVGTNSVSISGATITTGASCTITASVTDTTVGTDTNTTSTVSSTNGGTGTSATATLVVNAAPTVTKSFTPASVAPNATSLLTITITNPDTASLTGVAITDNLPSGMVVQATGTDTGCTGATFSDVVNSSLISITGATVANGTPCVIKVNVKSSTLGANVNTTGTVSSTNGGTGTTASATLTINAPPTIAKSFNPTSITGAGAVTALKLTFTNPNTGSSLSGINVTDNFPSGMTVADLINTDACGSTMSGYTVNSTSVSFTNITLPASGTCWVTIDVTVNAGGSYTNTTGAVSSTEGGVGGTATATVGVQAAPSFTSVNNAQFVFGTSNTFTVTATGFPVPTFSEVGALPTGVTLTSAGVLAGTPTSSGSFPIVITATNGIPSDATQNFTLTVVTQTNYTEPFNTGHAWTFTQVGACTGTCTNTAAVNNANCGPGGVGTNCVTALNTSTSFTAAGSSTTYVHNPAGYTWQTLGVPAGVTVTSVQATFYDKLVPGGAGCSAATAGLQIFNAAGSTQLSTTPIFPLINITGDTGGVTHPLGSAVNITSGQASSTPILIEFNLDSAGAPFSLSSFSFGTCTIYADNINLVINYSSGSSGHGRRGQVIIGLNEDSDGSLKELWAYNVDLQDDGVQPLTTGDLKFVGNPRDGVLFAPQSVSDGRVRITRIKTAKD